MELTSTKVPYFDILPLELIQHMYQYLSIRDITIMSQVCRAFDLVQQDKKIWETFFEAHWPMTFRALEGSQSRWDVSSPASKMVLYYLENFLPNYTNTRQGNFGTTGAKRKRITEDPSLSEQAKSRAEKKRKRSVHAARLEILSIVQTMRAFPEKTKLQQEICYIFRRLCYQPLGSQDNQADTNQRLIAEAEGLSLIIDLMKSFPLDVGIQTETAAAMINLALNGTLTIEWL